MWIFRREIKTLAFLKTTILVPTTVITYNKSRAYKEHAWNVGGKNSWVKMSIVISNTREDNIRMNVEKLVVWMELAPDLYSMLYC